MPRPFPARVIAAAGAVASRYLAVGTPRSFGIVIDRITDVDAAGLSLAAHLTWFAPSDIRCATTGTGAAELATATLGRVVSIEPRSQWPPQPRGEAVDNHNLIDR